MRHTHSQRLHPSKILFALGFGTAFSLLGDATLYTVLPTHTVEAEITLAAVGIMLGINRAVRLVFNGVAGWLYDRFSQRQLFLFGLGIGAFSTACYAVSRGFWCLFIGRVFWGMAWSLIWIGGSTILLNLTESSERGRWTGFYQTWFFLGAGTGAFAGGVLTDLVGYHLALWLIVAAQAFSTGVVFFLLPTIPHKKKISDSSQPSPSLRMFLNDSFCVTACLQGLNRFCISGMLSATLGLLVKEQLISPAFAVGAATITGALIAARTVISMCVAPFAGHVSDRLGSRWRVLSFALIVGVIAMMLLTCSSPILIVIGFLCSAVVTSSVQSLTITLTGDLVEEAHRGKAISLLHTVGDLGSALGPPCAYALLFHIGLTGVYFICAGLFAIAFGLILIKEKKASVNLHGDVNDV